MAYKAYISVVAISCVESVGDDGLVFAGVLPGLTILLS